MTAGDAQPWSPAHNPYAIAVSQAWWSYVSAGLFAEQAKTTSGPAQQINARQIFGQLRALHRCAEMRRHELVRRGVPQDDVDRLDAAVATFDVEVPGAKGARDILEHFDECARGEGRLQKKAIRDLGLDVYEAATMFWGGGYEPVRR